MRAAVTIGNRLVARCESLRPRPMQSRSMLAAHGDVCSAFMKIPWSAQPADPRVVPAASTVPGPLEGVGPAPLVLARVRDGDTAALQALNAMLLTSPSYKLQSQGRLPSAREGDALYASLPPGVPRQEKFLWCAWQQQRLVGCIEVIRHWPVRDAAYIGLLQVAEALHRGGIGMQVLQLARQNMRGWTEVRRLRLAVSANNAAALAFWRKAGFREIGQVDRQSDFVAPLLVMERPFG